MHAELLRQRGDADAVGAGCSHSFHFRLRQRCSSASPWLCRRRDERVFGLIYGLDGDPRPLIPRGDQPLDPLSPVPIAFDGVHQSGALDFGGVCVTAPRSILRAASSVSPHTVVLDELLDIVDEHGLASAVGAPRHRTASLAAPVNSIHSSTDLDLHDA